MTMITIGSVTALEAAMAELAALDPRMADLWRRAGTPDLRFREPGFATLLRVIVGQQLSVKAAATIWDRLEAACDPLTPAGFRALDDETLRAIGFSRQKTAYGRGLAEALGAGALDLDRVGSAPDEDAIAELVAFKGLGRWTAECYLLFAHGRPDVWPADDLALATATRRLLGHEARPAGKAMRELGEAWRPLRSAAARLLWHAYGRAAI